MNTKNPFEIGCYVRVIDENQYLKLDHREEDGSLDRKKYPLFNMVGIIERVANDLVVVGIFKYGFKVWLSPHQLQKINKEEIKDNEIIFESRITEHLYTYLKRH